LLPVLTITIGLGSATNTIIAFDMACCRFKSAAHLVALNFIWIVFLVTFTGYEFFRGKLPDQVVDWIGQTGFSHLAPITFGSLVLAVLQLLIVCAPRNKYKAIK
jgi:hypothetical protein